MKLKHRKILTTTASLLIVLVIGYIYVGEFRKNWSALQDFRFTVSAGYLAAAFIVMVGAYLLETLIWHRCMNRHQLRRRLTLIESSIVVNASALMRYVPGRMWSYTAQLLWLDKYGIPKATIIYVNLICLWGSIAASLCLGLLYAAFYARVLTVSGLVAAVAALLLVDGGFILWSSAWLNRVTALAGKLANKHIEPVRSSRSAIVYVQIMYLVVWLATGLSCYFLAAGVGLELSIKSAPAIAAAMSLSWVGGQLVVLAPGGLGVREGIMLVMLKIVVAVQAALMLPIISRLLYFVVEGILGGAAVMLGIRSGVLSFRRDAA